VSFNPFADFTSRNTPLGAHSESPQFFAVDHDSYSVGRQIQQFSGLACGEELHRVSLLLHRFHLDGRGESRETNHGHGLRSCRYLHGAAEGPRFYRIELGKLSSGKAISLECSEAFRKNDDETATSCHWSNVDTTYLSTSTLDRSITFTDFNTQA